MQLTHQNIAELCRIARDAGSRIMPYFRAEHGARKKQDRSPVTDADIAAHEYILSELQRHFPGVPVVSEEDETPPAHAADAAFFLVDPLDGTRGFVRGEGEFTVNIGLIEHARPVYGVIYAPVQNALYHGGAGMGAFHDDAPIRCRNAPMEGIVVARSRSTPSREAEDWLQRHAVREVIPANSSIKFCWVAEGSADCYPRFGRTMEWDTAAGQAILEGAGGRVEQPDGTPLKYGKANVENPAFIAWGL